MKIIKTSEALPKSGRYVLAWLEGAKIPMRAMWAAQHTLPLGDDADPEWGEYSEEKDEYFCPAGWYEMNQHEEQHWGVSGNVVAWCELPRLDAGAAPAAVAVPSVPSGFALVPIEPTPEMQDACLSVVDLEQGDVEDHRYDDGRSTINSLWAAMLSAATTPQAYQVAMSDAAPALEAPVVNPDDLVAVPRDLIGSACAAIDKQRAAPKTLAELRRYTTGDLSRALEAPAALEGWREQFSAAVYDDLAAADNQDVPLEEYPARILKVLDAVVGPRHPAVILWRNDAIQACIAIAYKYCRDPESFQYLKQDLQGLVTAVPKPAAAPQTPAADAGEDWLPTAAAINALPAGPRAYIHALAAHSDPAGMVAENTLLRDQTRQLDAMIGRLKAQQAAALAAPAAPVDDLAQLVKQLVQALRKAAPNHVLPAQALDYLKRQGLQGSPLRAAEAAPQAPAAPAEGLEALLNEALAEVRRIVDTEQVSLAPTFHNAVRRPNDKRKFHMGDARRAARNAAAALEKAFAVVIASNAAAPAAPAVDAWLQPDDMAALQRFHETAEDDESYDIGKEAVARLCAFGCLQSHSFGRYSTTDFGDYLLGACASARTLPFATTAERAAQAKEGGAR